MFYQRLNDQSLSLNVASGPISMGAPEDREPARRGDQETTAARRDENANIFEMARVIAYRARARRRYRSSQGII